MKNIYLIPFILPLAIFILLESIYLNTKAIYFTLPISIILIFLAVLVLVIKSKSGEKWWNFIIFPIFLLLAFDGLSLILVSKLAVQILYIACSILLYYYFFSIYLFFYKPGLYKSFTIENLANYGSFIIFFLLSLLIYGLESILDVPVWILILLVMGYSLLITYQVFWAHKVEVKKALIFSFINCLILVEIAWTISYLPVKYSVAAMALSICYYIAIGLSRLYLLEKLDSATIKLYLSLGLVSLLIIMLTAQWI